MRIAIIPTTFMAGAAKAAKWSLLGNMTAEKGSTMYRPVKRVA
jgi:hypothetical protein